MLEFEELSFKQTVTYCDDEMVTIPLKNQGAVYIGGLNAAGKSLPFNVLYNILFGRTPLSSKGKRKLIANPGYYASVRFKYNHDTYEIKQFFDNPEFTPSDGYDILKNGTSLRIGGGIPEAEKYIVNLLPFTAEEFGSFYYLSQDSLHVLAYGRGSERLEYLSKVFGFDIYDKIRALLKKELDTIDAQLIDVVRAQEEVIQLSNKLQKFPSMDLLNRRERIFTKLLTSSKEERAALSAKQRKLEQDISTLNNRLLLTTSINEYGELRTVTEISQDVQTLQEKKTRCEEIVHRWATKSDLFNKFIKVQNFVSQNISASRQKLDNLVQSRGRASTTNTQIGQKKSLVLQQKELITKLVHDPKEVPKLLETATKDLICAQASARSKKTQLSQLLELGSDGGKCSRCNQPLDESHIKEESKKLQEEIKYCSTLIKTLTIQEAALLSEKNTLEGLQRCADILTTFVNCGDQEVDIQALDQEITKLKEQIRNTEEALRLQQELLLYKNVSETHNVRAKEYLSKIQVRFEKLQDELGKSKEKRALQDQLMKLPEVLDSEEVLEQERNNVSKELKMYDEAVPALASDLRESVTLKTMVNDYLEQLESRKKIAGSFEELSQRRRVINACCKAYMPNNLKKAEVCKVADQIAKNLNHFVPLIFSEPIEFSVDIEEGNIDILFKRGNQPFRDVRFLNGGYKKRFLIALIPTLAGLISIKKRCNLIILDEVDSNMDDLGRCSIGEFLIPYLKKKFCTIIVISPSNPKPDGSLNASIPLDGFDKIWTAEYKNGCSHLHIQ